MSPRSSLLGTFEKKARAVALGPEGRAPTATELVFAVAALALAAGYLFGGNVFAHLGLSLPYGRAFGEVPGTGLKLYVSEIFILLLIALAVANAREARERAREALRRPGALLVLVLVFMAYGFVRLLPDLQANPALAVRNACFVWYLVVPCLILVLPLRPWLLERCFAGVFVLAWLELLRTDVHGVLHSLFRPDWAGYVGFTVPVAFALMHRRWKVSAAVLFPIAFGLAAGYVEGFQRVTLVGIAATVAVVPFLAGVTLARYLRRLALFAALIAASLLFLLVSKPQDARLAYSSNPFKKSESDAAGVEVFRKQMWVDAWGLFTERPLIGIGFRRQVVYRYFTNDPGRPMIANERAPVQDVLSSAPVAGPHNSYLNALARMGVPGALILVIHLVAAATLWQPRRQSAPPGYPAAAMIIAGLILYAFFNVALEGPQRSMFGLWAVGLAMKVAELRRKG